MNFLIFILATTGLTMICVKGKIFTRLRSWITNQYTQKENFRLMKDSTNKTPYRGFWKWQSDIWGCGMCFSMYAGTVCAGAVFLMEHYEWIKYFLYPLCAVPIVAFAVKFWEKLNKS